MNKHKSLFLLFIFFLSISMFTEKVTYAENVQPEISAPSVILMDGNTGQVLYKKNENEKHYPASITKLMTALIALENLKMDDSITFSKNAVLSIEYGSSHIGIQEGEILTIDQAMHGLLLMSANEVANGLAEKTSGSVEAFAEDMNERAHSIGATHSNFVNPHGLHDENHYTTAYDMALIAKELVKNDSFLTIMKDITFEIPPTNKVTEIRYLSQQHKMMNEKRDATLYREDVIGGKTGYTNEARHTLVTIAKQDNQILIAVILSGDGNKVYDDTEALLDYGFSMFKKVTLEPESFHKSLPIIQDDETIGTATLTLQQPIDVFLLKQESALSIEYKMDIAELKAPVSEGDVVGTVTLMNGNKSILTTDAVIDQVSIDYIIQETSPKVRPWIITGLLILIGIIIIRVFTKRMLRRNQYRQTYSSVNRSKNHYSKYANKRLKE